MSASDQQPLTQRARSNHPRFQLPAPLLLRCTGHKSDHRRSSTSAAGGRTLQAGRADWNARRTPTAASRMSDPRPRSRWTRSRHQPPTTNSVQELRVASIGNLEPCPVKIAEAGEGIEQLAGIETGCSWPGRVNLPRPPPIDQGRQVSAVRSAPVPQQPTSCPRPTSRRTGPDHPRPLQGRNSRASAPKSAVVRSSVVLTRNRANPGKDCTLSTATRGGKPCLLGV